MSEKRDRFLLHGYDAFWNNVSRSEDTAWKMIAAYSALIAGVALARDVITTTGAAFILIVFGYLGSCLFASANLWNRRNLTLIGRIEQEFLRESDYGKLFPTEWKRPRRFWALEYWCLFIFALPAISIFISFIMLASDEGPTSATLAVIGSAKILAITSLIGFILSAAYVMRQWLNYRRFLKDTTAE